MFVDTTITNIKVMGEPKSAVFYISCSPKGGEGFAFQFCETLACFNGLTSDEVKSYILKRIGEIIEETLDSRQQLDVNNKWLAREQLIDKSYRFTLVEEPIEGQDKFVVEKESS